MCILSSRCVIIGSLYHVFGNCVLDTHASESNLDSPKMHRPITLVQKMQRLLSDVEGIESYVVLHSLTPLSLTPVYIPLLSFGFLYMEANGCIIIYNVKEKSHIIVCTLCTSVYDPPPPPPPLCKRFIEPPSDGLQSCVPKEDVLSGEILFCILPASETAYTGVYVCAIWGFS